VLWILASALQQVRRRILFPLHTHGCNGWVRWNHSPLHMGGLCDKLLLIQYITEVWGDIPWRLIFIRG
jgi:hypothetical protein